MIIDIIKLVFFLLHYYVVRLGNEKDHKKIIRNFEPVCYEGGNVVGYLKSGFAFYENGKNCVTYLIRDRFTKQVVAYFTLRNGSILAEDNYCNENNEIISRRRAISGVELKNFAVNMSYRRKHPKVKNIGSKLFFNIIFPRIKKWSYNTGASILFIFALPYDNLINYYKRLGFEEDTNEFTDFVNEHSRPSYDNECKFMFIRMR